MATTALSRDPVSAERAFFFRMAIAFAATVVVGFSLSYARMTQPPSTLPIQIHLHAMVFVSWVGFYLVQNGLVATGSIAIHRRLGAVGGVLAALMVVLGIVVTVMCLRRGAVPFFFMPGVFLLLDVLGVALFGALVGAAIGRRNRPDWHKRLMLCAMAVVISPALGRILPMPLFGIWSPVAVYVASMLYIAAAMVYDVRARGSIHPAYWWGTAGQTVFVLIVMLGGFSAPVIALADWIARA
ncbi:hypothetical protein [Sphingomonas sp. NFR15]|uniref:hypothetical protein n=1 Tax=Sphingomonas sp. NFR15 TaxID=1566282 RepID=UPI00088073A8|nr:hypothetical protein [Sphingomonas sp. NFR15]SDA31448.1 hypothetical protein SAMN03159340_02629 [Sphingomonas sp. NFR15]